MTFSKEELNTIVRRVVNYYLDRRNKPEASDKKLMIIPENSIGAERLLAEYQLYGYLDNYEILTEGIEEEIKRYCPVTEKGDAQAMKRFLNYIDDFEALELYSPPIDLMKKIVEGNESDLLSKITIYFLLKEKSVVFRLPYDFTKLPAGRFTSALGRLIEDASDMGVVFTGVKLKDLSTAEDASGIITVELVEKAYGRGIRTLEVKGKTIITPLAKERAKELGITFNGNNMEK